jgi:hypothetical protein
MLTWHGDHLFGVSVGAYRQTKAVTHGKRHRGIPDYESRNIVSGRIARVGDSAARKDCVIASRYGQIGVVS